MPNTAGVGWSAYRPSKTMWLWSLIGVSLVTMATGFLWGGWTTTGRAKVMTNIAVRDARAELVANVCVHRFIEDENAVNNLRLLKARSSWERDDFINEGGWVNVAGLNEPVTNAADACAANLVKIKELPLTAAEVTEG